MNNRLLVPRKTPGLLDLVPGAAAAYSLRSLSNSYADPVVTVRRSSDDAEENFTASEVADGTLAAFCGAGDGFVYRWWDQSGNANHAVAPADANEPQIVDSGVVITEEGKPAIKFDGSDYYLNTPYAAGDTSQQTLICLFSPDSNTFTGFGGIFSGRDANDDGLGLAQITAGLRFHVDTDDRVVSYSAFQSIAVCCYGNSVSSISLNGVVSSGAAPASISTTTNYRFGGEAYLNPPIALYEGTMQEAIVYPSDLTSQRELIEGNIAWSYSQ
jgi:hypothetical protein